MSDKLEALLKATRKARMSAEEEEEQRQSFAYGNTNIENSLVTRETIKEAAESLRRPSKNYAR